MITNVQNNVFNGSIGLDAIKLRGYTIEYLDPVHLRYRKNVDFNMNPNSKAQTENGIGVATLIIDDAEFGQLKYGVYYGKATAEIKINVSGKNNLRNLTVAQYRRRIAEVFNYIEDEYEIQISYSYDTLDIKTVEINATFPLDGLFADYERVFNIIEYNIPAGKYYNNPNDTNTRNKVKSISGITEDNGIKKKVAETKFLRNSARKFIIYDKTKDLSDKGKMNLPNSFIRIEYELRRTDSYINKYLGYTVDDLTDDNIIALFIKLFTEEVINPVREYQAQTKNNLLKEFNKYRVNGTLEKNWREDLLNNAHRLEDDGFIPMIVDYEDLIEIINQTKGLKNKKRLIKRLTEAVLDSYTLIIGQNKKIDEIFDKVIKLNIITP